MGFGTFLSSKSEIVANNYHLRLIQSERLSERVKNGCILVAIPRVNFTHQKGPTMSLPGTITRLLLNWRDGDRTALDKLIPLVHHELRRLARHYVRQRRAGQTLVTTELINEAYLRLVDHKDMRWQNRAHFYAVAARAMRLILIDHARSRLAAKRGGGTTQISLSQAAIIADGKAAELIALDEALSELAAMDQRKSRVVELRYFGGLSVDETAKALKVSPVTVMREWRSAKSWLLRAITR